MEGARRALPLGAVRSSPSSQLLSKLNFIFELRLVLKAIVARKAAHQLAALHGDHKISTSNLTLITWRETIGSELDGTRKPPTRAA